MHDAGAEMRTDTLDGHVKGKAYRMLNAHDGVTYPMNLVTPFRFRAKSETQKMREAERARDGNTAVPVPETIGDDERPVAVARPAVAADVEAVKEFVLGHISRADMRMRLMYAGGPGTFTSEPEIDRKYGKPTGDGNHGLDYVSNFGGVVVIPAPDGGKERVVGTVHAFREEGLDGSFDISFLVDSNLHGRGIGGALIQMLKQWAHDNPTVKVIHGATINPEMAAVFIKHGFDNAGRDLDTEAQLYVLHRRSDAHPKGF